MIDVDNESMTTEIMLLNLEVIVYYFQYQIRLIVTQGLIKSTVKVGTLSSENGIKVRIEWIVAVFLTVVAGFVFIIFKKRRAEDED